MTEYESRLAEAHDQIMQVLERDPIEVKVNVLASVYSTLLFDGYDRTEAEQRRVTVTCGQFYGDAIPFTHDKREEG